MAAVGCPVVDVIITIEVELIIVVDCKTIVVRTTDVTVDVVEFPPAAAWGDLRNKS